MLSSRATRCEPISEAVLGQLWRASQFKGAGQAGGTLWRLWQCHSDAEAGGPASTEAGLCASEGGRALAASAILPIFNHFPARQAQVAEREKSMQQVWTSMFPMPVMQAESAQQAALQQQACKTLRHCFDQLEFALDKRARLLPWAGFEGLADAIAGAKMAGLDAKAINAEFCQRPLTVSECVTLEHNLSHSYFEDEGWELAVLASPLLYGSHEARLVCAESALAAARATL